MDSRSYTIVSYARADRERIRPLVERLNKEGVTVWWDDDIEPGQSFRSVIREHLDHAACVIVAWSKVSIESDWVRSEANRAYERGVYLPILLDKNIGLPHPFDERQTIDLSDWITHSEAGGVHSELPKVLRHVRALAERGSRQTNHFGTLQQSYSIEEASRATADAEQLANGIYSLRDAFVGGSAPVGDLQGALDEIDKSYKVVGEAIDAFVAPGLRSAPLAADAYLSMEGDALADRVRRGRGHCDNIASHYYRYGGIRSWLRRAIDADKLAEADTLFSRLSTADSDLFRQLATIGETLQNEATAIINMLVAGQEDEARRRILRDREKLQPLRKQLTDARQNLQDIRNDIGLAKKT